MTGYRQRSTLAERVAARWRAGVPMPWEMTRQEFSAPVYPRGKAGYEVLYHGTYSEHLPSILRQGLLSSKGSGLWASVKPGGDRGEVLIQFQIPPGTPTANRSSAGGFSHVEVKQDVPPGNFLSVHGPWPLLEEVEDGILSGPFVRSDEVRSRGGSWHEEYVQAALKGGFQVPPTVLREYPLLSPVGMKEGGVRRMEAGSSPAESAALSLLKQSDMTIEELIEEVKDARMLFDPISRTQVSGSDVIHALERLQPPPISRSGLKVYHATNPRDARTLLTRGFIPSAKPVPLGGSYGPGQGLDLGLYVGATERGVESYGRVTLEIVVPRQALSVPTELQQLGETNPLTALRSHDGAVVLIPIPPSAFRVVEGERYLRG